MLKRLVWWVVFGCAVLTAGAAEKPDGSYEWTLVSRGTSLEGYFDFRRDGTGTYRSHAITVATGKKLYPVVAQFQWSVRPDGVIDLKFEYGKPTTVHLDGQDLIIHEQMDMAPPKTRFKPAKPR